MLPAFGKKRRKGQREKEKRKEACEVNSHQKPCPLTRSMVPSQGPQEEEEEEEEEEEDTITLSPSPLS